MKRYLSTMLIVSGLALMAATLLADGVRHVTCNRTANQGAME